MFKLEALRRAERAAGFAFIAPEDEFGCTDDLIVQAMSGVSAAERARYFHRAPRTMPTSGVLGTSTAANLPAARSPNFFASAAAETSTATSSKGRGWSVWMGGMFSGPMTVGALAARS